jgi:hypothetical protein
MPRGKFQGQAMTESLSWKPQWTRIRLPVTVSTRRLKTSKAEMIPELCGAGHAGTAALISTSEIPVPWMAVIPF